MKRVLEFVDNHTNKIIEQYDGEITFDSARALTNLVKLKEVWDELPKGEHIHFLDPNPDDKNQYRLYEVCGQKFTETVNLKYMKEAVQKKYDEYGARAKAAEANEGVDWKAISHAMRAAYQVIEILLKNELKFPLAQAQYLLDVKQGKYHYLREAAPQLEYLMDTVEKLSVTSDLPDKVNREYWESQVIDILTNFYFKR